MDDSGCGRPAPQNQVEGHLPAAVRDREPVDFGLVEVGGPAAAFRDVSRFGDEPEGDEPPDAPVARRDRDLVALGDFLSGERLLVQRDQDPEGVVIQEGLSVPVVQQELLGHQLRSSR